MPCIKTPMQWMNLPFLSLSLCVCMCICVVWFFFGYSEIVSQYKHKEDVENKKKLYIYVNCVELHLRFIRRLISKLNFSNVSSFGLYFERLNENWCEFSIAYWTLTIIKINKIKTHTHQQKQKYICTCLWYSTIFLWWLHWPFWNTFNAQTLETPEHN